MGLCMCNYACCDAELLQAEGSHQPAIVTVTISARHCYHTWSSNNMRKHPIAITVIRVRVDKVASVRPLAAVCHLPWLDPDKRNPLPSPSKLSAPTLSDSSTVCRVVDQDGPRQALPRTHRYLLVIPAKA